MKNAQKLLMAAVAFSGLTLAAGQVAADTNAPTYTVTIPATVNLADTNPTATIKAENVSIDTTRYTPINVKLAQASNTASGSVFHVKEAKTNDTLSYSIRKNRRNVSVGDTVAQFTSDGETTLNFTKPRTVNYAGSYTENLTFDISVNRNPNYVPVTSVTINEAPSTVDVGATGTLTATVGPEQATDKTMTWESSNPDALAINAETGAYEAKAGGTATVTVKAADGKTATCTITVNVPVTSVAINNAPSALTVGNTGTLTATVGPEQATDRTVTWESSNPDALAINATTGEYEAKAAGIATITARAGNQSATCDVTVSAQQQYHMLMAPAVNQQQPVVEESEAEKVVEEPVSLTAADMLVNGNTTTVTFTVDSVSYSVTFTNNDGSYVINSQSAYEFGVVKSVSQVGNSIVITFGAPYDDTNVTQIIFNTDTSGHSITSYGEPSQELMISGLTSITVNGEIVP
ncbi:Ig-like domain (group 2) [Streptococcus equinus]|uniref:Ig-like domain-containing protein n=1 Tax=Streptococcus equinus TaxID=1335 RepID=UPI000871A2AD|nr:Ig-like domain-containing protein [Streptococcus equinus]SCW47705.1 Ig-like domain (group 2) [Streptococcus equinus]